MKKRGKVCLFVCLGLLFLLGTAIWSGIYFGIYYPLLHRDWKDANCTLTSLHRYKTYDYSTNSRATVVLYEARIRVINGTLPYFGYACETPYYHADISDTSGDGKYPYSYVDCEDVDLWEGECMKYQLFQPKWMCLGYENDQQRYKIGDSDSCKYYIHGENRNFERHYPNSVSSFVEILFQAEIYIPKGHYYALWVIPFGLMGVFTTFLGLLAAIGLPLGWFSDSECQKYGDFCVRFVCCRRKKRPKCVIQLGAELTRIQPAPVIVWLYLTRRHAEGLRVKQHFVREIADYLL